MNSGQGHDLIRKGHVAYQSIRMIILNTSIVFFIVLVGPYKTLLPKTAGELSWPEMTLATWRGGMGRNIATKGFKSNCNLMFESVSNGFHPKQAPFIFLHYRNGEVAKLTWPWVTYIKISRYIFYRYWYGYPSWKFQGECAFGVAMTSIQTFSEVRSLDVTWWPDVWWPGSDIFTFEEKMHKQVY